MHDRAHELGYDLRVVDDFTVGMSFDETTSVADGPRRAVAVRRRRPVRRRTPRTGSTLRRDGEILEQAVFRRYHTEHEMLRYLRRLADKDLALDRTMIPLGSCTMKLNATVEMIPVTWPEFAAPHPFAPDDETEGYRALIAQLEEMLAVITGYDAVSLQPNAGSQGELAGLLAIRAYHRSRGEEQRTICLIPSSAHGTNAASAVMAGMDVVVVACDSGGNVDLDDLRDKAELAGERLAALMVTYPSTHGVFEEGIREMCAIVHEAGGQVYVDGANLNALVGVALPGQVRCRRQPPQPAQDVLHPARRRRPRCRSGGGARSTSAAFLPGHPLRGTTTPVGPVSAAPYGSAGILPIPWVYIALMGARGPARRDRGGDPRRQLHRRAGSTTRTRCSTRTTTAASRTSASSTCVRSPRRPASPSTTSPSG